MYISTVFGKIFKYQIIFICPLEANGQPRQTLYTQGQICVFIMYLAKEAYRAITGARVTRDLVTWHHAPNF